ncbi:hypothetical protein CVT24_004010 [Panaeolus cyanescens]|uniref:DUF1682 domain-containing protein n=1 Tax=Panaeolus cyanescens TaxID=181874 RepID=A0A409Y6D1_9AGAR|nr:hypothetical protein CVT24_004010 [Panaeolus cyanescens]
MASFLVNLAGGITPPPVVTPEHYDGWQLRWKFLVFRPAELKTEALLLAGEGKELARSFPFFDASQFKLNFGLISIRLAQHLPIYEKQFSRPQHKGEITTDGYTDFFNFSTGRRNVASLHTIFTFQPRHDLFQWLFQLGRTLVDLHYRPLDDIQLDFKLAPSALSDNFVFAIVAKDELLSVKNNRWDLNFTKATESNLLPPQFTVMSEYADITENILKPLGNFSIVKALENPKILPYFRSLSITDQPRHRPDQGPIPVEEREKHVILSLSCPSSSHVSATVPLVEAIFQLVDNLNKISLRPETKNKLKKTRDELDKTLKEESEKEKKEEAQDAKLAAKRKAQEERIAKLSPSEQRKELEKERKRSLRKSQAKVVRK